MTNDQKLVIEILQNHSTRNSKLLASFVQYCFDGPQLRFWQALTNWCGHGFIFLAKERPVIYNEKVIWRDHEVVDPYNWEEENRKPL